MSQVLSDFSMDGSLNCHFFSEQKCFNQGVIFQSIKAEVCTSQITVVPGGCVQKADFLSDLCQKCK